VLVGAVAVTIESTEAVIVRASAKSTATAALASWMLILAIFWEVLGNWVDMVSYFAYLQSGRYRADNKCRWPCRFRSRDGSAQNWYQLLQITCQGISRVGVQGCSEDVERKMVAEREARTRSALANHMPRLARCELRRQ
jgi:hypothetical protein